MTSCIFRVIHPAAEATTTAPGGGNQRKADNNGTERDIRSLAVARSDGGTHRADWSAAAFARLKSVIVTGMKNQVRFIQYGIEVVRAKLRGARLPLPLE